MEQIILLEYNERTGGFHYNLMEYVSATRGYNAVSLCSYQLAGMFTEKFRYKNLSFVDICKEWEKFFNEHREDFKKIGLS